jgi:hypothetical protein
MNYRDVVLISDETATTPTTRTIPLSVTDMISQIDIEYKATSAGTQLAAHPAANVSKIQVVDGSDVLWALSGLECQGLEFYDVGKPSYNFVTDSPPAMAISTYRINFGRYLWDPSLGLDCSKFKNPQLLITHNYRTADTAATTAVMSVTERAFDKKVPSFVGFLSAKEIFNYTCGAQGSMQQVVIPRDRVLRKLMLQGVGNGYWPYQIYDQLKLSENNDAAIPLNTYTTKLEKWIHTKYGRFEEYLGAQLVSGGRTYYTMPTFDMRIAGLGVTAAEVITDAATSITNPTTILSAQQGLAYLGISGYDPHGCLPIEFGDQQNIDDWYDVTGLGSLNLNIIAGSAAGAGSVNVVTEQKRLY